MQAWWICGISRSTTYYLILAFGDAVCRRHMKMVSMRYRPPACSSRHLGLGCSRDRYITVGGDVVGCLVHVGSEDLMSQPDHAVHIHVRVAIKRSNSLTYLSGIFMTIMRDQFRESHRTYVSPISW